jgi:hypothetical protein
MRTNLHALIRATALALCAVVLGMGVAGLCQPILPFAAAHADDSTNDFGHLIRFAWPETGLASRVMLDGVQLALTTNATILASNISAPWPRIASVTAGTNYWSLTFSVEQLTRWSGKLNESTNVRGPFTPSGLAVGQRITGPNRFFAAVLTQGFEVVPWSTGPWAAPQYGGPK